MRNVTVTAMIASILVLSACGGRTPEPVRVTRASDGLKNCAVLAHDIEAIEFEIFKLLPKTNKLTKNAAYGAAGFFAFFIPWLLVDFQNAEAKEYEALRARHEHLAALAEEKKCNLTVQEYPTIEEVKKEHRRIKGLSGNSDEAVEEVKEPETTEVNQ